MSKNARCHLWMTPLNAKAHFDWTFPLFWFWISLKDRYLASESRSLSTANFDAFRSANSLDFSKVFVSLERSCWFVSTGFSRYSRTFYRRFCLSAVPKMYQNSALLSFPGLFANSLFSSPNNQRKGILKPYCSPSLFAVSLFKVLWRNVSTTYCGIVVA